MADEHQQSRDVVGLSDVEWAELHRLRQALGQQTFDQIQQRVWNDFTRTHEPPYYGVWLALLVALREAARH